MDARLSSVILQNAGFTRCRFVRCRFAHADLREVVFEHCDFADPDSHSGPQFAFSRLDEARFLACDLSFADAPEIDAILHGVQADGYRARALLRRIVQSHAFTHR